MKKLMLLTIVALTLMACPSDDDNPPTTPPQDALIGTWKYFQYFEDGVEQPLEPCDLEDTLIFDADGTFSDEFFTEVNGDCVSDETDSGTWMNVGDSNYAITLDVQTETVPIVFENNTFYIEIVYDNDTPDDTTDDVLERDVYIRQ